MPETRRRGEERVYRANERQVNEIGDGRKPPSQNNRSWNRGENYKKEFSNSNRPVNFKASSQTQNTKTKYFNPKAPEQKQENLSGKPENQKPGPSEKFNTLEKILKSYVPIKKGTCFNCHSFGHNFTQCAQDKQILCEVCVFPGFLQKDCQFCTTKNVGKTAQ